jgi:ABC-type Na+ transport system ATPase subunit NatA
MDEADKIANTVAIIDHGKIISIGSAAELKTKTNTKSLEEAFLSLTGHAIREEESSTKDQMRMHRRMWAGKR